MSEIASAQRFRSWLTVRSTFLSWTDYTSTGIESGPSNMVVLNNATSTPPGTPPDDPPGAPHPAESARGTCVRQNTLAERFDRKFRTVADARLQQRDESYSL